MKQSVACVLFADITDQCFRFRKKKIRLAGILGYFQINLQVSDAHPTMECDCNLFDLQQFINTGEANLLITEAAISHVLPLSETDFRSWTCRSNRIVNPNVTIAPFLQMPASFFLCRNPDVLCPDLCICYKDASFNDSVVDCTNNNLINFPEDIPISQSGGKLIVSLEHNRIVPFVNCDEPGYEWLQHVTSLNLQHNEITPRSPVDINNFLRCLKNITHLYLAYNNIKVLPASIQEHRYETFSISRNKLICDCTTFWMKSWLQKNKKMIVDSSNLQCLDKCKLVCYNDQYTYQQTVIGSWLKILVKVNIL